MNTLRFAIIGVASVLGFLSGCASDSGPSRSTSAHELSLASADARACDILIDTGAAPDARAVFAESVRGTLSRRGQRLAVSMISRSDVSMTAKPFALVTTQEAATPKVLTSTCYDRAGAELPSATATFD